MVLDIIILNIIIIMLLMRGMTIVQDDSIKINLNVLRFSILVLILTLGYNVVTIYYVTFVF